jgi:hypothetical protein
MPLRANSYAYGMIGVGSQPSSTESTVVNPPAPALSDRSIACPHRGSPSVGSRFAVADCRSLFGDAPNETDELRCD